MTPSALPPLSPAEQAHADRAAAALRGRIAVAGGWLPFADFMEFALYSPGLGYYSAGSAKLGAGGDFVTAPEVSSLWSGCVARECARVLASTGGSILEFGAGTGRMAVAVLETLAALGVLPERYSIIEVSADLAARQREQVGRLPAALRDRVQWLQSLPAVRMNGVVLANEVLDALPCERFIVGDGGVQALGVGLAADGSFSECLGPADAQLARGYTELEGALAGPLPRGYRSELCTRVGPWIGAVAACLDTGVAVLSDYGLPRAQYYHPQRLDGTLRCHFKHRVHDDPLANVSLQDVSAWVDFTRVAEAADAAGLAVLGFTTQAAFLLGAGVMDLAGELQTSVGGGARARELRRLLLPGEMGEAFKVMTLGKGFEYAPAGIELVDLRASL